MIDGTAIFHLTQIYAPDGTGVLAEAVFAGGSNPIRSVELDLLFSAFPTGGPRGLLHLCAQAAPCAAPALGGRELVHAEAFRVRDPARVSETWFRAPAGAYRSGSSSSGLGGAAAPAAASRPEARADEEEDSELARLRTRVKELKGKLRRRGDSEIGDRLALSAADEHRKQEKAHKKRKKKKRKRKGSSTSRTSTSEDDSSLFRVAPSRNANGIRALAEKQPGTLYQSGLEEITRVMGLREGASGPTDKTVKLVGYLQAILLGKHSLEKIGPRSGRELRTLAEAMDHLAEGRLPQVADLLMQRFKALEQSISDGHWGIANQLELVDETGITLTSAGEQRAAARAEMLRHKLEEARKKNREQRR